jgi:hypoxanthine phosphoribosyltransferase
MQTLKGATIFASDLVRAIHPVPDGLEMGFVRASSYGTGTKTSGKVVLGISTVKDEDIRGRHILLVSLLFVFILFFLRQHKSL